MSDLPTKDYCVTPEATIKEVMECLNRSQKGIALVTDSQQRLLGTIADGDLRRAMLNGYSLLTPANELLEIKRRSGDSNKPVTASLGTSESRIIELMKNHAVRQIPLIDENDSVADLVTWGDIISKDELPLQAIIMAGGFGTRLAPLTESTPKPLLPVGEQPIMEVILEQLAQVGVKQVNVATHYMEDKIRDHFGDGSHLGMQLNYVTEDQPLGTAGALSLMEKPDSPLLIINGDILTKVDFRAMLEFHREQDADLTVGVRKYEMKVPYGVVQTEGTLVSSLEEKPELSFFVNAGIYLLDPKAHHRVPHGERIDMTDLIARLIGSGCRVASFPIIEYWLDIGNHLDYQKAQRDMKNGAFNK